MPTSKRSGAKKSAFKGKRVKPLAKRSVAPSTMSPRAGPPPARPAFVMPAKMPWQHRAMWAGSFATSNPRTQRAWSSSRSPTCVHRTLPFATAVLEYQKHRVKKLKKQGRI
jgi:hypothetical protein